MYSIRHFWSETANRTTCLFCLALDPFLSGLLSYGSDLFSSRVGRFVPAREGFLSFCHLFFFSVGILLIPRLASDLTLSPDLPPGQGQGRLGYIFGPRARRTGQEKVMRKEVYTRRPGLGSGASLRAVIPGMNYADGMGDETRNDDARRQGHDLGGGGYETPPSSRGHPADPRETL